MIKHESALDLFQRLFFHDENFSSIRFQRFFPNGFDDRTELIELFDHHRIRTKEFLHGFIDDYLHYRRSREEILTRPLKVNEILFDSPRATNKDSVQSEIPLRQSQLKLDRSLTFLYIDTESKECLFNDSHLQWFDCETSADLIGLLLRFEQMFFIRKSNEQFIVIIDSSTQLVINDYFHGTSPLSYEENRQLTIQWHRLLIDLMIKYKFCTILIEHLEIDFPLIVKNERRHSKMKDSPSELSFARLMVSEHYHEQWKSQLIYRQISCDDVTTPLTVD